MPKVQCQHCRTELDNFEKICPRCEQPLMGTTAVQFIGDGLSEFLAECVKSDATLARKKTTLYLKLCQSFLCDSELALLSVKMHHGAIDESTSEAIDDVINTHRQHVDNLRRVFTIISEEPSLQPIAKKVHNTGRRVDNLLKAWLLSDFGGRGLS
ncbi:MAG: hypothetical protein LBV79_07580 [Candidatus Adiutrix sp.]|nr:hypothetical protein [Candidatus Adiutrix sp.]